MKYCRPRLQADKELVDILFTISITGLHSVYLQVHQLVQQALRINY